MELLIIVTIFALGMFVGFFWDFILKKKDKDV